MLALLQGGLRTREERTAVSLPCRLNDRGRWTAARIRNVSSRGMLVAMTDAPEPGSYVEMRIGSLIVIGRVVWKKDRLVGVRLQDRLDVAALLEEAGQGGGAAASRLKGPDRPTVEERPARTVEQSRYLSVIMQYAAIVALTAAAAGLAGMEVYRALDHPASTIEGALAGNPGPPGR